ncbi:MAG: M14 family metallopeptidase [Planctomycetota bacterium]
MRRSLLVAVLVAACVSNPVAGLRRPSISVDEMPTVAEASGYTRTSLHAGVVAFMDELAQRSDLVRRFSLGTSGEGRDLAALVIADPPVSSADEARASGKLRVFLVGNIHAGEVCGKEALLALSRELAGGSALLRDLVVVVLPDYNPDGNDRLAPGNRPGQNGPDEMGTRANAGGFDLNRDWVKADAPETRAYLRFLDEWDPQVVVDTHTTNGSHHRYTITYQGPKHPAGDEAVIAYVRDEMLPACGARLKELTGFDSFFYGNFESDHTRWTTYPAEPRYGAAYRGLRNRLSLLSEAYAYASFDDRVVGTREFCRAILENASAHAAEIRELCEAADARTLQRARNGGNVALRVQTLALPGKVAVLGFDERASGDGRTELGAPKDWECSVENLFVPSLEVALPRAYVFPAEYEDVAAHLELHGIRVARVAETTETLVEHDVIDSFRRASRPFEGHARVEDVETHTVGAREFVSKGAYLVDTAQPLGALAAYLLEPRATDGLVAWNFFDAVLAEGARFPVGRVRGGVPDAR